MEQPEPAVFILDRDEEARDMLIRLARSLGYRAEIIWDPDALLDSVKTQLSGCIVIDAWLPGMSGLDVQRDLRARGCDIPVIMTCSYSDVALAVDAMKIGAYDFIEKPFAFHRMREAIQGAVARDENLRETRRRHDGIRRRLEGLSKRELEVIELVAEGYGSSEIAVRLGIQTKTVEVHRSHINKKMNARNTADLVRMYHALQTDGCVICDRANVCEGDER